MFNPQCIRDTLLSIKNDSWGSDWVFFKGVPILQKYSEKEVAHHLKLCYMVEMLGEVFPIYGRYLRVRGLSEGGQEFVDNITDEDVWARLVERVNALPPIKVK